MIFFFSLSFSFSPFYWSLNQYVHPSLAIVGLLHVCTKIGHTHSRMHWAISYLYFFKCPATKETWPKAQPAGQRPSRVSERADGSAHLLPPAHVHVHVTEKKPPWLPLLCPSNPIIPSLFPFIINTRITPHSTTSPFSLMAPLMMRLISCK